MGRLDQWARANGVPLQNKPCKEGLVEEEGAGPHIHHNQKTKPICYHLRTFFFFLFCFVFQQAKRNPGCLVG